MNLRRSVLLAAAALMLAASLIPFQAAFGWGGCGAQVVVPEGDTLSGIALRCGASEWAIVEANPGMGWNVYAGQVLKMPGRHGSWHDTYPTPAIGGSYTVRWGDTLGKIAMRYNVSLRDLLAVNRWIWNPDLIYPWQVINLPAYASQPPAYVTPKPDPCYYGCYSTPKPDPCYFGCYGTPLYPPAPTRTPPPLAPPIDYSLYRRVTVTYKHGLLVRNGPGREYAEIESPLVSAVKDTQWWYRKDSVTTDGSGFVWAEVYLYYLVDGRSTGWIMVGDALGGHFTDPYIEGSTPFAG